MSSIYPFIDLNVKIITQPAVTSEVIQILEVIDDPIKKIVKARVQYADSPGSFNWYTVWQKESYDNIGEWTDQQLAEAVKTIVISEFPTVV